MIEFRLVFGIYLAAGAFSEFQRLPWRRSVLSGVAVAMAS